jgi:rRNA-processing protein FCF1
MAVMVSDNRNSEATAVYKMAFTEEMEWGIVISAKDLTEPCSMDILCDTSFLMVIVSKPIKQVARVESQFGRLDFLVPDIVQGELERLVETAGPKRSTLAKTALVLAKAKFRTVAVAKARHVDDSIIEYAGKHDCAVATIDTNLRRRLIANEVLVLTLSRDRLIVANPKLKPKDHI